MNISEIMTPPSQPLECVVNWDAVEASIRNRLPDDYKDFIEKYGTGRIDRFVRVLSPVAENVNVNLLTYGTNLLRAFREHKVAMAMRSRSFPFALFPEPGGLLPWGYSDNGDVFFWRTGDANPNNWRVVVSDGRASLWEQFEGTMSAFLCALLSRQYESKIVSDEEFPSNAPKFDAGGTSDD